MTPSRRQFVASIATVPLMSSAAFAQPRAATNTSDPVLDQILSDLRELSAEFENEPRSRKATMRAMESTLGIGAAHLATYYDGDFKAKLRRHQSRLGRAVLTQDLVNRARDSRQSNVTHEAVDAGITRLDQRGLSGCLRDVRETIRKIRLQAPDQMQAAGFAATQYDYCADLYWMISMMEGVVAIVCGIALLEPTPGGEIACGALTLSIGLLYLQRSIFC